MPYRSSILAALLAITLIRSEASAMNGNRWMRLSEATQDLYVAGVMDAWEHVTAISKTNPEIANFVRIVSCASDRGMTYGQIAAIVKKYMKDNPAEWHYTMASLVWTAMNDACGK